MMLNIKNKHFAILAPVYNDWESFSVLVKELDKAVAGTASDYTVYAVDDASIQLNNFNNLTKEHFSNIVSIKIIKLALNIGHQKAIAIGLCNIANEDNFDAVIVMDSDGENVNLQ